MAREFDVVIFGFTGYTGHYVLRELLISIEQNFGELGHLKWAVAGRDVNKLRRGLENVNKEIRFDWQSVPIIEADVSNSDSLDQMAKRTKVLVNTVGPYRFYGRQVVEACLNTGTHHLDISGESQYIEKCVVDYHRRALENGTVVISTCGWDSIPFDLGVDFLKRNFNGTLHSVETFMKVKPSPQGYQVNIGTFKSALYELAFGSKEIQTIRRQMNKEIFSKPLPPVQTKLLPKRRPFKTPHVEGWNFDFPTGDRCVVRRTQRHNFDTYNERPTQMTTYYNVPSVKHLIGVFSIAGIFGAMSMFPWSRRMIEKYPHVFTFGAFSRNGPTRKQVEGTTSRIVLVGRGWGQKVDSTAPEPAQPMNKEVVAVFQGKDPGYVTTSTCLVQSALTVILERDKLPKGGVLTPAFAFRNTNLRDRLEKRGLTFQQLSAK